MIRYSASFSNGFTNGSNRNVKATHGWHAAGKLRSGRPWARSGFSLAGERGARREMGHLIKYGIPPGATVEFSEIVAVRYHAEKAPT
jgi:hypothetical protein